mgnify:CR=1 FL=1|jgi:G2/mitotic-specific cyclin-B, other
MLCQTDVNPAMRSILLDWLVDVHLKFKLEAETLHLTVNLLDRYLEKEVVSRRKLQLVGLSALFIASKYEEVLPPEASDFVHISDKAFTRKQLLTMEGRMLSTLAFHLTAPSSLLFLTRFATIARLERDPPCRTQMLARYLLELALPQCSFYSHPQSLLAATALHLALRTMGQSAWVRQLPAIEPRWRASAALRCGHT